MSLNTSLVVKHFQNTLSRDQNWRAKGINMSAIEPSPKKAWSKHKTKTNLVLPRSLAFFKALRLPFHQVRKQTLKLAYDARERYSSLSGTFEGSAKRTSLLSSSS